MEKQRILTEELKAASEAYYNGGNSGMSDMEFDHKLEELQKLETESGVILSGSPTVNVGAATVKSLKEVKHEYPALSLDKVKYKDRDDLVKWLAEIGDEEYGCAVMSWKMDGSTVVLTYDNGYLTQAVTRGNGEIGNDITHNAVFFKGVPKKIPYSGHVVVRGEAFMTIKEFERIKEETGETFENARNLASATIKMLDSNESKKREICFKAFELICPEPERDMGLHIDNEAPDADIMCARFMDERFLYMEWLGFDVVDHTDVNKDTVLAEIDMWQKKLPTLGYPTDGLVFSMNDLYLGWGLGATEKHPRWAKAMKWTDETVPTIIKKIEWSVGKTGVITPVAVFETVRLGLGSNVERASLHNLNIMKNMPTPDGKKEPVRIGAKAEVYLANMIIPQIATISNSFDGGLTCPTEAVMIPDVCPVCGQPTRIENNNGVEILHCDNKQCAAQTVGRLMNTFSKDGLFIKGLGESQIVDLIDAGLITDAKDVYTLKTRTAEDADTQHAVAHLLSRDGWGRKKWDNLMDAIEASRDTTLQKFLYSLNIPLLGNDLSKKLAKFWDNNIIKFRHFIIDVRDNENGSLVGFSKLVAIDGVGDEKANNVIKWIEEITAYREIYEDFITLIDELKFPKAAAISADNSLEGLTFVITGSVSEYKNRDEFKASVEARGGKVSGSVSAKTSFLVNNDVESTSGKNKKAKELGIEIISEDEFISRFGK